MFSLTWFSGKRGFLYMHSNVQQLLSLKQGFFCPTCTFALQKFTSSSRTVEQCFLLSFHPLLALLSSPSFYSVRNMAFPYCDSSQMAVAEPRRWSYLQRTPLSSISATQMVQSTSHVSNRGAIAKTPSELPPRMVL